MPRPSRDTDKLLIQAGLELLPESGCRGLNIRKVCQRAGVNLGMFHYHFKTKEPFLRAVLQAIYERLYGELAELETLRQKESARDSLRRMLITVGKFARDHRKLVLSLLGDYLGGDPVVTRFASENVPRHAAILMKTFAAAQKEGSIVRGSWAQLAPFVMTGVNMPNLISAAIERAPPKRIRNRARLVSSFRADVLTDEAIERRVDFALKGLSP